MSNQDSLLYESAKINIYLMFVIPVLESSNSCGRQMKELLN